VWRALAWAGGSGVALCLVAYWLSVPFYAGAGTSFGSWRMEHGRLTVGVEPDPGPESFYVAVNHEGLRFGPGIEFSAWDDFRVTVPLWAALLACAGLVVGARAELRRARPGLCRACGHSLHGLRAGTPRCPECGAALGPPLRS
jgi:hypothetical protein